MIVYFEPRINIQTLLKYSHPSLKLAGDLPSCNNLHDQPPEQSQLCPTPVYFQLTENLYILAGVRTTQLSS